MPVKNGSGFMTSYNSSLGESETAILDAGIPLFEIKPTTLQYFADKIMGLWSVRVNYRPTANNKISTTIDWYNQKGAYVVVDVFGKDGKRFAYVPDDPLWHNRMGLLPIVLGNKPVYEVLRYHTQQGFGTGARSLKELVMFRDLTHEWIVRNRDTGVIVCRSFDGVECDEYIAKRKREDKNNEVQVASGAEVIIRKAAMYKESDHLELRSVMVPSIQKIIDRASVNWMMDEEWRKELLPEIQKKISDRFGESDLKERCEEALRYLPEIQSQLDTANAQLKNLMPLVEMMKDPAFANMIKQFAPGAVAAAEKVVVPAEPLQSLNPAMGQITTNTTDGFVVKPIEVPATHTEIGETDLKDLSITSLRQIASTNFGVKDVKRKSQEAILAEIREKQGIPDEEASEEADSVSVDE